MYTSVSLVLTTTRYQSPCTWHATTVCRYFTYHMQYVWNGMAKFPSLLYLRCTPDRSVCAQSLYLPISSMKHRHGHVTISILRTAVSALACAYTYYTADCLLYRRIELNTSGKATQTPTSPKLAYCPLRKCVPGICYDIRSPSVGVCVCTAVLVASFNVELSKNELML